jgi:hypothetical protein
VKRIERRPVVSPGEIRVPGPVVFLQSLAFILIETAPRSEFATFLRWVCGAGYGKGSLSKHSARLSKMGGDLGPGDRLAKAQTRREPRPFRFCRLACRERRHYRSRTGAIKRLGAEGTGDEIYSESKSKKLKLADRFQAKRLRWTWAEPLAAPTSKIIRNQKIPSRRHAHRSRYSGLGRFTAAQGLLAPASEIEYFAAHIQPHGSPHLNSASATVPAFGRRNPIIDTGCSDHPVEFQPIINLWQAKYPAEDERDYGNKHTSFFAFDEGHIDMAWVERTNPIRYEDHLLERSTRIVIDSFLAVAPYMIFLAVAPYMIDSDSRSRCRAPSSSAS